MTLIDDRNFWRDKFEQGGKPVCHILQEYKKNRDNSYWRVSSGVEELCEYILYLERLKDEEL